jgi:SAM-dependent methyltransferase
LVAPYDDRMAESRTYWRSAAEDEAMQDAHGFVWKAMLDTIDVDLDGTRALDAGCNRGGFLRLLCDDRGIAEGRGYDPAAGAIADAQRLAGDRPLTFAVADTVPTGWDGFDVAFSHEVLYMLHDLAAHARAIFAALASGGVYFGVIGVHAASPFIADWHRANIEELHLPPLYGIDEVAAAFATAGFDVAGARLNIGFVPVGGHANTDHDATITADGSGFLGRLEYYNDHKILMRFQRPVHSG